MRRRAGRRSALALLVVVVLVAAGCGSDDEDDGSSPTTAERGEAVAIEGVPGVTATEIRFAAIGTDSNNPTGSCYLSCFLQGVEAYFAYRNDAGGMHGRDLVLTERLDDQLGKNQEMALRVISEDEVFGVFNVPVLGTGYGDLAEAGIPVYSYITDQTKAAAEQTFNTFSPTCVLGCTRLDVAYAMKAFGAKNIAILSYGVPSSAQSGKAVADTVEQYAAELPGVQVAYENVGLAFGLPNGVGPEVTEMKRKQVDMVFTSVDDNATKTIAVEMQRQGMDDASIFHINAYNAEFIEAGGAAFEHDFVETTVLPPEAETGSSGRALFEEWMTKEGHDEHPELAAHGWIAADIAYRGLKDAGAPFDRQKVIDATNAITRYTADGLIAPFDIGRQHELPTQDDPATHGARPWCRVMFQIVDGAPEFVEPATPERPFLCWSGESYTEYSDPEARAFE